MLVLRMCIGNETTFVLNYLTAAELEMLAQAVSENIGTIRAKFSMGLTNDIKNKCWVRITERYG
jgi:hypothetical protein